MFPCRSRLVPALVLLAATTAAPTAGTPLPISSDWSTGPVWDDGRAEVAVYEAGRVIYGAERPYEAVLLTVKEDFDTQTLNKADPPLDGRPIVGVLKQNAVREIPTPNYDYRIMTSTFVERSDPSRLVKLTSGSHEWCGNTWKAVRRRNGRTFYDWSSYFDGEGDGVQDLDLRPGDLFEDQLPLVLRGLRFSPDATFETRLLPGLATSHAGTIRSRTATFVVVGKEQVRVPAGTFGAWRVSVRAGDRRIDLWFDAEGTHPLVRMETSDGEFLKLKKIERRAYWVLPRP